MLVSKNSSRLLPTHYPRSSLIIITDVVIDYDLFWSEYIRVSILELSIIWWSVGGGESQKRGMLGMQGRAREVPGRSVLGSFLLLSLLLLI